MSKKKGKADPYANERAAAATDEEYALGCKIRALRDQGEAWWAIAAALKLDGYGDSAKTGKRGAGKARRAYAAAFGSHPRSQRKERKGGAPTERNENAAKVQQQRREDRLAKVRGGESVLDLSLTDAELEDMLRGRKVRWMTMGTGGLDPVERDAWVHPDVGVKVEGEGEDRVLNFREYHSTAPADVRWMPAQHRTIPLVQIYEISKRQLPTTINREPRKSKRAKKQARIEAAS